MSSPLKVLIQGRDPLLLAPSPAGIDGSLVEELTRAGLPLNTRCGRRGDCAGCTVRLLHGSFRSNAGTVVNAPATIRACQGSLMDGGGATISIPPRSLLDLQAQIGTAFKLRVLSLRRPLVRVEPDVRDHGFAIDVGTTTVVVALVDLRTGGIVAEQASLNRQVEFGDNVVTRIQIAGDSIQREALRQAVVQRTLLPLMAEACRRAHLAPDRVAAMTIAGNTTMLHLLVGADPSPMGVAPFTPQFTAHRVLPAGEIGFDGFPPNLPVHLLPGFSAFVGADIAAGCVSSGMLAESAPSLLVDIGTNGELLLSTGGRLIGSATAAGPAFEGGRLTCGTRAVAGAISHVRFTANPWRIELEFIGDRPDFVGLAGSAYLDFLAAGRTGGLLDERGRFTGKWETLPPAHRWQHDAARGVLLRAGDLTSLVTESDIAQLQQAKAAIAAGIATLLRRAHLTAADVHRVFLAGGFGLHLDPVSAIRSGLLPGFRPDQIETLGNTALGGAWLALDDTGKLEQMNETVRRAEILELNTDPEFEDTFIDQLALP